MADDNGECLGIGFLLPVALDVDSIDGAIIAIPEPPTIDWDAVLRDSSRAIVITNSIDHAYRLCLEGQPAYAVLGVSLHVAAEWFRARGGKVSETPQEMN